MKYIIGVVKVLLKIILTLVVWFSLLLGAKWLMPYDIVLGCMFIAIFIISVACLLWVAGTFLIRYN